MSSPLIVKLGAPQMTLPWTIKPEPDLRVIGTVSRGPAFGHLAVTATGEYLQVNGSMSQRLNGFQVREAIRVAKQRDGARSRSSNPPDVRPTPVVVVRKRRRIAPQDPSSLRAC